MDVSSQKLLMEQFVKMVDRRDLQPGFPEQFRKHWENKGRSGTVQIFTVQLVDQPCEITFSLFFDNEDVIQTGIRVKFKNEEIVNAVRKGDTLDYKHKQRIDPVAFLKEHYASNRGGPARPPSRTASYTLQVDDDSEAQVFRAMQQLTGRTEEEIKELWRELINTNVNRAGKDQVSPIIKTWLKGQRDRLDMQFLNDVELLQPRPLEVNYFTAHGRSYTVACKRMRGKEIKAKIDQADPEWWGGAYYAIKPGGLTRVPHEQNDRLLALQSFDTALEFPVEDIYIDSRHIYAVVFIANEALVWRTRDQAAVGLPFVLPPPPEEPGKMEKLMARFKRKAPAEAAAAPAAPATPSMAAPAVHPFYLARTEKAYLEALAARAGELNDRRKEYMQLLYESDRMRFGRGPEELQIEMEGAIAGALKKDPAAMQREIALVRAHVTIFYAEQQAGA